MMIRRLSCYTDASFRSKSLAGIACIIIDTETKKSVVQLSKRVTCKDSCDAELRALHQGLVQIRKMEQQGQLAECVEIKVHCDSQSVVEAVNGECRIPKYSSITSVLEEFSSIKSQHSIQLIWIERKENQLADRLASEVVQHEVRKMIENRKAMAQKKKEEEQVACEKQERFMNTLEQLVYELRTNNILMSKMLLRQQREENVGVIDVECLWNVLKCYEGEVFYTVTGKEFTYELTAESMKVKNIKIAKNMFCKAVCQLPVQKPCEINGVIGKSYVFSILGDVRIGVNKLTGSKWAQTKCR